MSVLSLFFTGCMGGTFGNHADIEQYPLRAATKKEGDSLKRCLQAAHRFQQNRLEKTGELYERAGDIPIDSYCRGYFLGLDRTGDGYEIIAQFHKSDRTVRWSVNQDGVIEEHLEGLDGEDIDFF